VPPPAADFRRVLAGAAMTNTYRAATAALVVEAAALAARAAAARAAANAAHACAAFAAQAGLDAALAASTAGDDEAGADGHWASASQWEADADAHRESFRAAVAEVTLWDTAATAARRGLAGRAAVGEALLPLLRRGRIDLDHAAAVLNNARSGVVEDEVLLFDEGVAYSIWGHPVYWW